MHDVLIVSVFVFAACCLGILGGVVVGGWLHHRGVLAGRGINENFIGDPKGEVFRIPIPGEVEDGPEESKNENLEKIMNRVDAFKSRIGGMM